MTRESIGPQPEETLNLKDRGKSLEVKRKEMNERHLLGLIQAIKEEGITKEDLDCIKGQAVQMGAFKIRRDVHTGQKYLMPNKEYSSSFELFAALKEAEEGLKKSSLKKERVQPIKESSEQSRPTFVRKEKLEKVPEKLPEELKDKFYELMDELEMVLDKADLSKVKQKATPLGLFQKGKAINKTLEAKEFYNHYNSLREKLYGQPTRIKKVMKKALERQKNYQKTRRMKIVMEEALERQKNSQEEKREKRQKEAERKAKKQERQSWQEKLAKLQEELKVKAEKKQREAFPIPIPEDMPLEKAKQLTQDLSTNQIKEGEFYSLPEDRWGFRKKKEEREKPQEAEERVEKESSEILASDRG